MTLAPVPAELLPKQRPLFQGFSGLHGAVDAALEGSLGTVTADEPADPRVCHVAFHDFHVIAGDPGLSAAREALEAVPQDDHIAAPESWHGLIQSALRVRPYDRFAFQAPAVWDTTHLAALRKSLAGGYCLQRVDATSVGPFAELATSLIENFASPEDFLRRGVGFGVTDGAGRFVSGCSSYTISSRCVEFEIQTHPDFRRRGLALVTGAALIEHCLDTRLEPCWDAAHEGSAILAERLGFVGRTRYTAFSVSED
jgi:hypothetical protein